MLPRASLELKHMALGANAGGPLTVRPKTTEENGRPELELAEPQLSNLD